MKSLTPATPHVIILVGVPGAGKTTFAEQFADTFQAPIISTRSIAEKADLDTTASVKMTTIMLDELLKTQRTLVYDGPASTKAARMQLMRRAHQAGYRSLVIWVQTESMEAKRRSFKSARYTNDVYETTLQRFQAPTAGEGAIVISGKHTYATQLRVVLKHLATLHRPKQEAPARNITVR